jgi:hypothetical protein
VIGGHGVHDLAVAAVDQDVGDLFGDGRAAGDRGQVGLRAALGEADEVVFGQRNRVAQHRPRDLDILILGEVLDDAGGEVRQHREARRNLALEIAREQLDDLLHDVVEEIRLARRVLAEAFEVEVGDLVQQLQSLLGRSLGGDPRQFLVHDHGGPLQLGRHNAGWI